MRDQEHRDVDSGPPAAQSPIGRRDLFKLVGGGIVVLFSAGDGPFLAGQEPRGRGYPADFNAYLRIAEDGRVTVYTGKIEMGQDVVTSLAQMAADELGVALATIDMVMGDTDLCPFDNGTNGSLSVRVFGPALRTSGSRGQGGIAHAGIVHS